MDKSEFMRMLGGLNAEQVLEIYVLARTGHHVTDVSTYIRRTMEELEVELQTLQSGDLLNNALK